MGWILLGGMALMVVGMILIFRTNRTGLGTILVIIGFFLIIFSLFEAYGHKKETSEVGQRTESVWQKT